jgi:hypothetical protein
MLRSGSPFGTAAPARTSDLVAPLQPPHDLTASRTRASSQPLDPLSGSRQIPSVQTQVIDSGGRRFLEVERFDRIGNLGRRGLLSLGTVEDAFLPQPSSDGAVAAGMLQEEGWISEEGARLLRWKSVNYRLMRAIRKSGSPAVDHR